MATRAFCAKLASAATSGIYGIIPIVMIHSGTTLPHAILPTLTSFGQEFYPHESILALKLADKSNINDRSTLTERIATLLPQASPTTRRRVAAKFIQRYLSGSRSRIQPPPHEQPFVRLVARHRHIPTQIELLYYQLTKTDTIVGALARELFYPVCVENRPPAGCDDTEFAALNGSQLLAVSPLVTRSFILQYARLHWNFANRSSIDRSLRVLQGTGLIARERMTEWHGHPIAFRLSDHDVSPVTFIYALYDEWLNQPGTAAGANSHLLEYSDLLAAGFVRTLLLSPAQVEEHCETARRHQLLVRQSNGLRLVFNNLNDVVSALLSKAL